jgi:hypothetical protein
VAVYSSRYWKVHNASGVGAATFTVPAGYRGVLRSVDVYYGGSGAPSATIQIDGAPVVVLQYFSWSPLTPGSRSWSGGQVIETGETVEIVCSDAMDTVASGYLLPL